MSKLISTEQIRTYSIQAVDGSIGHIEDFYFDDHEWTIRYIVVDTGNWLAGRKVLLSPLAFSKVDTDKKILISRFTMDAIKKSPDIDTHAPVSRQEELKINAHYGHDSYWKTFSLADLPAGSNGDLHLRSVKAVNGYHLEGNDGGIGHVKDFIINDRTWEIRYLIIDTQNLWPGKKVLISPQWIERISWIESKVFVNHSRETIKLSPKYTEESLLTRDYESELYRHYSHQGYWADELIAKGCAR